MIEGEKMPRNRAILLVFYTGGFRVAELCGMKWSDLQPRDSSGQITVFGKGSKTAADQVWVARYILNRLCEKYGVEVEYHCKPIRGDWNGSGMHANFSTTYMRDIGGKTYFDALMAAFAEYREEHIAVYGPVSYTHLTLPTKRIV